MNADFKELKTLFDTFETDRCRNPEYIYDDIHFLAVPAEMKATIRS